ncbi:WbqC family protein [Flavihumibacter sp. CACIAM 22H1]|uniref:WbqC family protein n=1 Tax=Flavihumibacter sp. CACIAM 22H1 TaxID=1812911 RepID=UPI0007A7CC77|nr:WbqC family protein [Flavihumibacter sp. CACIAM 22H1]KYP14256.1 MAG: hypothetical protein A1D16_04400 [Flavihumibacter sp. CACIAM 22H1]
MSSLIIDLQYFANVNWYKKVYNYKYVYLNKYEQHTKMSFRNRTMLAGATGPLRLTVPIEDGRNERQFYKEVNIVSGRWQLEHFRAIVSCYNRSPWFEYYRDEMAVLFETPASGLFEWNLLCHQWVVKKLGLADPFTVVDWGAEGPDWRGQDGQAADNLVNFFHPANTASTAAQLGSYTQVFQEKTGFIAGLSILDLLFCEGPSAKNWLLA